MRLPRRRSPLERLGTVQRYAELQQAAVSLSDQLDRFAQRLADLARRLDDLERRLRG